MNLLNVQFVWLEEVPKEGLEIAELLVRSNMVKSKTDGRRFIEQKVIKINNSIVVDPFARLVEFENQHFVMQRKGLHNEPT